MLTVAGLPVSVVEAGLAKLREAQLVDDDVPGTIELAAPAFAAAIAAWQAIRDREHECVTDRGGHKFVIHTDEHGAPATVACEHCTRAWGIADLPNANLPLPIPTVDPPPAPPDVEPEPTPAASGPEAPRRQRRRHEPEEQHPPGTCTQCGDGVTDELRDLAEDFSQPLLCAAHIMTCEVCSEGIEGMQQLRLSLTRWRKRLDRKCHMERGNEAKRSREERAAQRAAEQERTAAAGPTIADEDDWDDDEAVAPAAPPDPPPDADPAVPEPEPEEGAA